MALFSFDKVSKYYGVELILKDISFNVERGQRIGLLGENGAGKTTLLKLISGEIYPDEGRINLPKDITLGYLRQKEEFSTDKTVIEVCYEIFNHLIEKEQRIKKLGTLIAEEAHKGYEDSKYLREYEFLNEEFSREGGYEFPSKIKGILSSMAFTEKEWNKSVVLLSGGERTRLALACLLLKEPDLLLLDEPTNHLDIGTIKWLEQYIKSYKGTLILVSHDRYFLDQIVDRIFYVENHQLNVYNGGYGFAAERRREERENIERAFEKQQKHILKQEEMIRRFKGHGTEKLAKRAASREKALEKIDRIEAPLYKTDRAHINFKETFKSGKDVLYIENLSKTYGFGEGKKTLFSNLEMDIKRGEKICILGPNGVGKTTLLKIIMSEVKADKGFVKLGHNVKIGYYDQRQQLLNDNNNLVEELAEDYGLYSEGELRKILGSFLFRGEEVFRKVGALSGGERARLSLLKVMMSGANLLIMDEPTNHLDIESKEVFEDAILDFPGTALIVSHDRYLLKKVPDRILELTTEGINNYLGDYDYYLEKSKEIYSGKKYLEMLNIDFAGEKIEVNKDIDSKEERRLKKEEQALQRKLQREKENIEKEIEDLEAEKLKIEVEMCLEENLINHEKLSELSLELKKISHELEKNYEKWLQYE